MIDARKSFNLREEYVKAMKFALIDEKIIDPVCLQMLSNEGIMALQRAKKRKMERIVLACEGTVIKSVEEQT